MKQWEKHISNSQTSMISYCDFSIDRLKQIEEIKTKREYMSILYRYLPKFKLCI